MYEYKAKVVRVLDGDTCDVAIDVGFRIEVRQTLRLDGIDAPEMDSKDVAARADAIAARSRLTALVLGADLTVKTRPDIRGDDRTDSFGRRYLAVLIRADGMNVNDVMVAEGHAKPWRRT